MKLLWIIVAFLAMMTVSCSKLELNEEKKITITPRPSMLFDSTTTMEYFDKDKLLWVLRTQYLERWSGDEKIFARPINVVIFDSLGVETGVVQADSGTIDNNLTFIVAKGDVFLKTQQGASIKADSLTWDKRSNRITTDSRVRVISEDGDVLTGTGFISDVDLKDWRILSGVTAILQNVDDGLEAVEGSDTLPPSAK
ncbi:MAG: LPS export ABC transporter periplasmic protein LptC [Fibrobacterales bacterium]